MAKMYIPNTWINGAAPAIDNTNLNNIEDGISVANRQDLSIVVTPPTDADYTLTVTENQYGRIEVDTTNWTTTRNIIMNNNEHTLLAVVNSNGSQDATFKTSAGTGIAVLSGEAKELRNNTVNVIDYEVAISTFTGVLSVDNFLHIQDQKPSGTGGGTSVSGNQTRTLNTILTNTTTGSLSSNNITLDAGTYYVEASAPAFDINSHKASLYNDTDAEDILVGTSEYSVQNNASSTRSFISGIFTLASTKDINIKHYIAVAKADGLGRATSAGVVEVYLDIKIWGVN